MKLYYDRRAKDPTYFIQQGFRNGKKTTTKNIKRIGKHSDLLSITDDPLAYAKEQVQILNGEYKNGKVSMTLNIDFNEKLVYSDFIASKSTSTNVGYFNLQYIYHQLKLEPFFNEITAGSRIKFNCDEINRFLTYARILFPTSKLATLARLDTFYEKPSFTYDDIGRYMDILESHYDEYIEHLFKMSGNVVTRDTSVCFFDCTNFYFETESPDLDYIDEVTGEYIKGFRKYGPAKDHKPNPLVQMGLFMDARGIPISMCINSGSDNEQLCAVPLEKKMARMFRNKRFIYCADAGLGSMNIRKFNDMGGRAFIVTQSIKKLSKKMQKAVFNDFDYRLLSDDTPVTLDYMNTFKREDPDNKHLYNDKAYKVIETDALIDVGLYEEKQYKNGKTKQVKSKATMKQRIIVTFSRKTMEYQRFIRNRQVDRAQALLDTKDPDMIKKGPHDVTRFIKRTSKTKSGEDVITNYSIDKAKVAEEEKYDGFYAVATNLMQDPVKEVMAIMSNRYKIEECFRVLKTNFNSRPVYHQKKERIIAHFMICYTALLVYRLLECKLDDNKTHFSTNNIIETIKNMNVVNMQDMFYASAYTGSEVCTALNAISGLGLDKKYYQPKELNKKIKNLLK